MASTVDEDDPRQSSAALCISMDLLGESFRPEFTHQCFEGEWIRGYQPMKPPVAFHSSHGHHEQASHELQLSIRLSPSCRHCQVDVQVQRKPRTIETRRVSKRPRLSNDDSVQEEQQESPSTDETNATEEETNATEEETNASENDSDFQDTEEEEDETGPDPSMNAGPTRTRRMPVDEILERCGKALPTIVKDDTLVGEYLEAPIGTILKEYQRKDMDFVMSLADGSDAADYHKQVQKLALWFIETADCVDLASSEGGGYWKVLYLFRKHAPNQYSLAGYLTLFHFQSPFRKPKAGVVVRVCQALVLPTYQRMGHGKVLLKAVHEFASNDIVEINVEDPAPAFTCLRNRVDSELLQESIRDKSPWLQTVSQMNEPDFFRPVSDADALQAGVVARITPRQVQIALEIYKLSLLPNDCPEEIQKKYRLMVKKRLAKVHQEDLGGCQTKEEKQTLLAKIFDSTLKQYNAVLNRSS